MGRTLGPGPTPCRPGSRLLSALAFQRCPPADGSRLGGTNPGCGYVVGSLERYVRRWERSVSPVSPRRDHPRNFHQLACFLEQ